MPWATVTSTSQSYSTLTAAATTWRSSGLTLESTSGVSGLVRIYPQAESNDTVPGGINFAWLINSAAPWRVATGTPVYVVSTITVGV